MTAGALPRRPLAPRTRLGRWAVGLAVAHVAAMLAWRVLPLGGGAGLALGFAAGIVALAAILRERERAVLVFLALVPGALVLLFALAELLIGHD